MGDCLFCGIVSGIIPATRLHEDSLCIAIADIAPLAPTHLLILPREHLVSCDAVDGSHAALAGQLVQVAVGLAHARGLGRDGYRLVFNHGAAAGQTVQHLHLHLLGGRTLDAMG